VRLACGHAAVAEDLDPDLTAGWERLVPVSPPRPAHAPADDTDRALHDAVLGLTTDAPVAADDRVLVLVPDRTRAFPLASTLAALTEGLVSRGVREEALTVLIASGTHRATPDDVAPARLGSLLRGIRVRTHDPDGDCASVGTTPAGTPVRVHPALLEASRVFALGGTAFHYFAGFGGGPKLLFPGVGARASVAANHARSLGPWPPGGLAAGVEPGRLAGNPVAEDLAAAAALLPAATHVTGWQDAAGEWRGARWSAPAEFADVCARASAGRRVGARHGYDAAWASAGGWPRDLDVVQAHKALFHASLFVKDGGRLVFAAACEEGYGSAAMERWLGMPDRATLESSARARYDLNAQTAISLAAIAARLRVTWIANRPLPALERWGVRVVTPRDTAAALRDEALALRGARVAYLPVATDVLPAAPLEPGAGEA